MFNNIFFFENHVIYEKTWKNMADPDRPEMKIWRMSIACWIPMTKQTHAQKM